MKGRFRLTASELAGMAVLAAGAAAVALLSMCGDRVPSPPPAAHAPTEQTTDTATQRRIGSDDKSRTSKKVKRSQTDVKTTKKQQKPTARSYLDESVSQWNDTTSR